MRTHITWSPIILVMLLLASVGWAMDPETAKIMPWVGRSEPCLACHGNDKGGRKLTDTVNSCDTHCQSCHKDMEKHHSVGQVLEDKGKIVLPLSSGNKVACTSCHDLNTPRKDKRSWKSQSLFARLFQGQPSYPTYYLRVNNSDGKLCRICH